jgi:hypothetical protein
MSDSILDENAILAIQLLILFGLVLGVALFQLGLLLLIFRSRRRLAKRFLLISLPLLAVSLAGLVVITQQADRAAQAEGWKSYSMKRKAEKLGITDPKVWKRIGADSWPDVPLPDEE